MREDFELSRSRDWRERLSVSRDQGTGFAAPGVNLPELFMNGPSLRMENF